MHSSLDYFDTVFTLFLLLKDLQERTKVANSKNTGRTPCKVHKWYIAPWQGCFPFVCRGRERTAIGNGHLWAISLGSRKDRHLTSSTGRKLNTVTYIYVSKSDCKWKRRCALSGTRLRSRQKSISCTPITKWTNRTNAASPVVGISSDRRFGLLPSVLGPSPNDSAVRRFGRLPSVLGPSRNGCSVHKILPIISSYLRTSVSSV